MLGINNYTAFLLGTILTAVVPGANTYRVLEGVYQRGLRGGVAASAGVVAADLVFMVAAAAGLSALLRVYPATFVVLLLLGAVYFAKMGWTILTSPGEVGAAKRCIDPSMRATAPSAGRLARDSFLTCIANFKAIFFYGLFMPGFVDTTYARPWIPLLILCLTCLSVLVVYYMALCFLGTRIFNSQAGLKVFRYITVSFGIFVILLAAGMIYEAMTMVAQLRT